jgi:hypothetical protein
MIHTWLVVVLDTAVVVTGGIRIPRIIGCGRIPGSRPRVAGRGFVPTSAVTPAWVGVVMAGIVVAAVARTLSRSG